MATSWKPDGFPTVNAYLILRGASDAMAFYAKAFDAVESYRLTMPDGSIAHAEMTLHGMPLMLTDENEAWGNRSPLTLGGSPVGLCIYVPDADAAFAQAVAAGATVEKPMMDQFYGDRTGTVVDPFGYKWTLATHKEDVAPAEMQSRMEAWMASMHAA